MDNARFLIFFSILQAIFIFLEVYTLYNWQKFIKRYDFNKFLYIVPWVISIFILLGSAFGFVSSIYFEENRSLRFIILVINAVWIFPKLLIVPILLIKDIYRLFRKVHLKLFKSKSNDKEKVIDGNKRKILEASAWTMASVPFYIIAKGITQTTYDFQIHKSEVNLASLPKKLDGLRIIQISDLHLGSFYDHKPFQEVKRRIDNLKPDLLVITGDFVNNNPKELDKNYKDLMRLSADIGVYACLGNHDHYMSDKAHKRLLSGINETNINLLINEASEIKINNSTFQISAVDNYGMRQEFGDFDKTFSEVSPEYFNLFLCHDPRNWDMFIRNQKKADLMLSGHTHGGQVAWDMFGTELKPVKLAYNQYEGLYKAKDQYLYINRGLGTVGPPLRIEVPPEITEITLRS